MNPMSTEPDTFASIRTRYRGPTNYRGARVIVTDDYPKSWPGERRRLTLSWDHSKNTTGNHYAAACAWCATYFDDATIEIPGLAFDGNYYWTWAYKEVTR